MTRNAGDIHRLTGEALEEIHAADLTPHLAALAHILFRAAGSQKRRSIVHLEPARPRERVEAYEQAMLHYENGLRLIEIGEEKAIRTADFLSIASDWSERNLGLEARRGIEECETAIEFTKNLASIRGWQEFDSRIGHQLSKDDDESMTDMRRAIAPRAANASSSEVPRVLAGIAFYMAIVSRHGEASM